jgi:hypothetical protein
MSNGTLPNGRRRREDANEADGGESSSRKSKWVENRRIEVGIKRGGVNAGMVKREGGRGGRNGMR